MLVSKFNPKYMMFNFLTLFVPGGKFAPFAVISILLLNEKQFCFDAP